MNIENIEAFVYVVHLGSFNKAAEALYLTQPSITSRIRSLENSLNTKLFHRHGRYVSLTDDGNKLIAYAEKMLQTYQEATYKLNQHISVPDQIRVGCSVSISNYIIPEMIPRLKEKFPDIRIKLYSNHSEEIVKKLMNDEVDLGLVRLTSHPRMETKTILSFPIGLYAAPKHPLVLKERNISAAELLEHDVIFYDHNSTEWLLIHRLLEQAKIKPNVIMEVDNMETAKRLVAKGMGICILPEHSVAQELQTKALARIPLETDLGIHTQISVMHLKEKEANSVIDFFNNFTF
jgi:DNA-binding transcriptional LysR family regulator